MRMEDPKPISPMKSDIQILYKLLAINYNSELKKNTDNFNQVEFIQESKNLVLETQI